MITELQRKAIEDLSKAGWEIKEIVQVLDIPTTTVRRYTPKKDQNKTKNEPIYTDTEIVAKPQKNQNKTISYEQEFSIERFEELVGRMEQGDYNSMLYKLKKSTFQEWYEHISEENTLNDEELLYCWDGQMEYDRIAQ